MLDFIFNLINIFSIVVFFYSGFKIDQLYEIEKLKYKHWFKTPNKVAWTIFIFSILVVLVLFLFVDSIIEKLNYPITSEVSLLLIINLMMWIIYLLFIKWKRNSHKEYLINPTDNIIDSVDEY